MKHRFTLAVPALSLLLFAAPLMLSLLGACGDGAGSTAGKRVQLGTRVQAESLSFDNGYGWRLEIGRALVSIGPLYYLEGAVVAVRSPRLGPIRRWLTLSEAHAHPGHYQGGGTIGEMLEPASVDLALGPIDLAPGAAISGTARSARFSFQSPPEGAYAAELGSAIAVVEGLATQGAAARPFRASAAVEDVLEQGVPAVAGCEFENGSIEAEGVVTLEVRLAVWLDQVDFATVPVSPDGAPVELARGQTPHKAFVRGLKKAAAYAFRYVPQSTP